jgi:hypothetical protein
VNVSSGRATATPMAAIARNRDLARTVSSELFDARVTTMRMVEAFNDYRLPLSRIHALAGTLARDLDSLRASVKAIFRDVTAARSGGARHARRLARDLGAARGLLHVVGFVRRPQQLNEFLAKLNQAQVSARRLVVALERRVAAAEDQQRRLLARAPSPRVSRPARWIADASTLVLPARSRGRYAEEFGAELISLTKHRQLPYATRLACRAWSLRRSLRQPHSLSAE